MDIHTDMRFLFLKFLKFVECLIQNFGLTACNTQRHTIFVYMTR